MEARDSFNFESSRLYKLTKKKIVLEGIQRGFYAESSFDTRMKWPKNLLIRDIADRITRKEIRGY